MDTSALVISLAIVVHLLGIFLITINCIYLSCTKGVGNVREHGNIFHVKQQNIQRCFKIRLEKAWNLLALYHIALIFVDVIVNSYRLPYSVLGFKCH